MQETAPPSLQDETYMALALEEAQDAALEGEVPIGAVLVWNGQVIARDHNRTLGNCDPTAHAEIQILRTGAHARANHRLVDCDLFVTLEPCAMCIGACIQARIRRLVFGAADPRWGALGTRLNLGAPGLFNHSIDIRGGILAGRCRSLLQDFFRNRRRRSGSSHQPDPLP